ncbi:MAG: preprotein translocase subunit YajC [Planctomycetota bacterium]|nr:preprotein translocase subunit YajC [Planctomycetota bacterium]MEC8511152.1 preprotein translocase subunit YajC [Planctomycetota bacterium]MEE2941570.1 preprotein translocase subunit YajC [Planctomycetota bacterium]
MAPSVIPPSITLPLPLDLLQSVSETLQQQGDTGMTATDAQTGANPAGQNAPRPQGGLVGLWPLLAIGAIVWFLIFAPERKARKKREEMLGALKKGDKVVTTGGLHGQIADVRENEVIIKAGDVRLTFSRSSVQQIQGEDESA